MNVSHTYRHPRGESDKRKLELVISRRRWAIAAICSRTHPSTSPMSDGTKARGQPLIQQGHSSTRGAFLWVVVVCHDFWGQKKRKIRTTGQLRRLPTRQCRIGSRYHPHTIFCSLSPNSYRNLHYATGLKPVISPSRAPVFAYVNFLHTSHRVHSLHKAYAGHTADILDCSLLVFQRTSFSLFQPTKQDGSPTKIMKRLVS